MKRYIKSDNAVYCGKKIGTDLAFNHILDIAKFHIVGCVSAQVDEIPKDKQSEYTSLEDYNNDATDNLMIEISSSSYDYFETLGGWVSPDGTESEERSFIVIGPEYLYPDRVNAFKDKMVEWCREYYQWAVLIIDWVDTNEISDDIMKRRYEFYRRFYNPKKYRIFQDPSLEDEENDVYDDLMNIDYTPIYQLNAYYLDSTGTTIKSYNNISPKHVGQFFTQLARHQGAERMTLLASVYFNCGYIQMNQIDRKMMASSDFDLIRDKIIKQKTCNEYDRFVDGHYNYYLRYFT